MRMVVNVIVWRGKAYLPCLALIKEGPCYLAIEPVYVAGLNTEELLSAIQKVLAVGHPCVPGPTTREEADRLARAGPILKATKARSWKELARTGASYDVEWSDREIRVEMSRLDKKGRWEFDPEKRRIFPPDTPLEEIVAVILEDIRSRPEVWE